MWERTVNIPTSYRSDYMLKRLMLNPLHVVDLKTKAVKVPLDITGERTVTFLNFNDKELGCKIIIKGSHSAPEAAMERLAAIFQWEKNLDEVAAHFDQGELAALFDQFKGTPLVSEFSLYGCLIKTIIHQQLNMTFAYTLSTRFVKKYGEEIDGVWFYPRPERVAEIPVSELRALQFSQRKAEYVIGVSRAIVSGALDLDALRTMTDEEAITVLTSFRGVGVWTAECLLLFGLGRSNLLPAQDIGIQNGLKQLLQRSKKPMKEEIYEMGKGWEPYRSYASLYLWLSIEKHGEDS